VTVVFSPPIALTPAGRHHAEAARANYLATSAALDALTEAVRGNTMTKRILLRAAAGAGKSHALKRMVAEALGRTGCQRIGVTAFANKQVFPLAEELGTAHGAAVVCLRISADALPDLPDSVRRAVSIAPDNASVPATARVILATASMFGRVGWNLKDSLGALPRSDHLFEVLFIDEAWQLPLHLYQGIERLAPVMIGVGDVGQLPPLDPSLNPWRGDAGHNPYRAWPTNFAHDQHTMSIALPSVWRPSAAQLGLWRAFYEDWDDLQCVAAPGDRCMELQGPMAATPAGIWAQISTGVPSLVEVDGLPEPDAPDVDLPLLQTIEGWLDALFESDFRLRQARYDHEGKPIGDSGADGGPSVAVLATRNQAVDDAHEMVERLVQRHSLSGGTIVASTVDSWQGQTNGITVAIHPLSGASALDEFNSAFGRLAVTCTRATHGLLLVSRSGLDQLLATAPPRPGTPFGEPGTRQLPRQTHQRIVRNFARARVDDRL
jgi:hypothetical protein